MPSYSVPTANASWQTLTAPTADAWLQPIGGDVYISTDTTPTKPRAGVIKDGIAYPVTSGLAVKVRAAGSVPVSLRMWDK